MKKSQRTWPVWKIKKHKRMPNENSHKNPETQRYVVSTVEGREEIATLPLTLKQKTVILLLFFYTKAAFAFALISFYDLTLHLPLSGRGTKRTNYCRSK